MRRRRNNPYGGSVERWAEIMRYARTVEPLLSKGSTLYAQQAVPELADAVEQLVTGAA